MQGSFLSSYFAKGEKIKYMFLYCLLYKVILCDNSHLDRRSSVVPESYSKTNFWTNKGSRIHITSYIEQTLLYLWNFVPNANIAATCSSSTAQLSNVTSYSGDVRSWSICTQQSSAVRPPWLRSSWERAGTESEASSKKSDA